LPTPAEDDRGTARAPEQSMISFRGVSKSFGEHQVLGNLDLDVGAGEKVSIIGPSGSGKTTILRLLMTLEQPNSGIIEVDGDPLWNGQRSGSADSKTTRLVRRKIGMVFQHFNLFPHMTVLRNVTEAPIHVLGMSRDAAEERARELLGMVGLDKHMNHKPGQLSGGQQQRVAIARAMAMRPKVMLFDEVTSALDPELIGEVLGVIRELAHSTAMTMLLVTHEMRFAEEISDRVLMFDAGSVVEAGPPSVIFHTPENERTKRFLSAVLQKEGP
jgi:polar amino acid transport system ATP-binding protein